MRGSLGQMLRERSGICNNELDVLRRSASAKPRPAPTPMTPFDVARMRLELDVSEERAERLERYAEGLRAWCERWPQYRGTV